MNLKTHLALIGIIGLSGFSSAQVLIYDNFGTAASGSGNISVASTITFGDLVTLGGTDRVVTDFDFKVSASAGFNTDAITLYFYNVATGNDVGSLIGSTSLNSVSLASGVNTISFDNLSITIPSTVIWAINIDPASGASGTYNLQSNPTPSVGSSVATTYYSESSSSLTPGTPIVSSGASTRNFQAQITAVPEPEEYAFFAATGLVMFALIRKKFFRAEKALE